MEKRGLLIMILIKGLCSGVRKADRGTDPLSAFIVLSFLFVHTQSRIELSHPE